MGWGYSDIFIQTYARTLFLLKILNFNIIRGFQMNEYFSGYEILWIFFGGHHKVGLYLGVNAF